MPVVPRLVAWELTRSCNLRCRHCRASAERGPYDGELTLDEAKTLVDDLASFAKPILILTGGEPLLCPYLWDLVAYARECGLKPVIGTNATLIDASVAARIAASGISRISVSIDFPTAAAHDAFRGEAGAFDAALRGIAAVRRVGVEVQVNTTVTRLNRSLLPQLHELAVAADAQAFHPFLLVPTGRGADLAGVELSAAEYEETLEWVYETQRTSPLQFKPTDAPQYQRIVCQHGACAQSKGCLAGTGFCFVSHVGDVQPCGYFDLRLGNVRERPLSRIWWESQVLDDLRHPERLKGKCGVCEYKAVCGGCRARALARTGDYLSEEPYCAHVPDRAVLDRLQRGFPVEPRPYARLGRDLGLTEAACHARVRDMRQKGLLRRLGAFFDSRKLGFVSTLVALAVPEDRLDAVAAQVSDLPGVTHNYAREGRYNLWFTLIAPSAAELERTLSDLRRTTGVVEGLSLPATRTYKLRVDFSGQADGGQEEKTGERPFDVASPEDVAIVRALQDDIVDRGLDPFEGLSLERVRELVANGTIRRFGAVAYHRRLGFVSNALVAWPVGETDLDRVGGAFAAAGSVSHCYARKAAPGWPYTLYAMVHERSADALDGQVLALRQTAASLVGRDIEPLVLKTVREYKKTSMRYFGSPIENANL